ncbi:MAG: diacylglycerol kinase family protein [Bacteroidia bacterium]
MITPKWLLIVNPSSGNGKGRSDSKKVQELLSQSGIEADVFFSEYAGHTSVLVHQAIEKGYRKIISMGGDGTLNEVVNGIFNQQHVSTEEITIAVIPVGTGNDWCKTYKIPTSYKDAVAVIAAGKTIQHDIGIAENSAGKRYFINIAGMGYDGFVTEKISQMKQHGSGGKLFYLLWITYYLFQYKTTRISFKIDGKEFPAEDIFTLSVCVCRYNGDGMMQAPSALPDDGIFNITVLKKISPLKSMLSLPKMKNGTFVKMKEAEIFTGKSIEVNSSPEVIAETDGEIIGKTPARFSIIPNALNVIINQYPQ